MGGRPSRIGFDGDLPPARSQAKFVGAAQLERRFYFGKGENEWMMGAPPTPMPSSNPSSLKRPRLLVPLGVKMTSGPWPCSPVLEPVLCVLQPGLQVPDAYLLLLQWSQVLLWGWGLDAVVVTAQRVLHGTPVRGCPFPERKVTVSQVTGARGQGPDHLCA